MTKAKRTRRRGEGAKSTEREEAHRKHVATGGSDTTGTARGQNGETGDADIPEFKKDIGRKA